jgi:C4-type Zn-finger protein
MRWLHKLYANMFGYFWLECPVCSKEFGGHEHVWTTPLISDNGHAYVVCSHECGLKAQGINDSRGRLWPERIGGYADD